MSVLTQKHRVLVVDDNHDAATTLAYLLKSAGYEVETCFSGPDALATATQFGPDACVLDINMPGMDGYELARKLREKDPNRALVFATVTAYQDYSHLEKAVDAGFDLHFTKPADYQDVADQLADSIHKAQLARRPARLSQIDTDVVVPSLVLPSSAAVPVPVLAGGGTELAVHPDLDSSPRTSTGNSVWLGMAAVGFTALVVLTILAIAKS